MCVCVSVRCVWVCVSVCVCVCVCVIFTLSRCQSWKTRFLGRAPSPCSVDAAGFHSFSFHELKSITNNFDERPASAGGNRMGEGGFGVVYKGCVNNTIVAVKKLGAVSHLPSSSQKKQPATLTGFIIPVITLYRQTSPKPVPLIT